ncbi:MAG: bifunctional riboflavin kinase/FAD synthetase [Lachnospiraceae bacterium]|nr:bifunctional riboflavin kinase/FAD synthetase [Lachnospiraceae bacterium]
MQVVSGIADGISTAVAIGKFDGMHLGHEKLLKEIKAYRSEGLYSLVFTFEKPVADFFTGDQSGVLTTNDEKLALLEEAGIDYVYMMPVNKDTVSYEPEAFVREMLISRLHARVIAAGADLSFGDKGAGDMELLKRLSDAGSAKNRFKAVQIDKVMYEGEEISSTLVRDAVSIGNMERAGAMLGRPYFLHGEVVHGRKLGRTIGIPTANLIPDADKLMPPFGVYHSRIRLDDGRSFKGITNIGVKPTIKDDKAVTAETHIFDFDEDIYGRKIQVSLCHFERREMKFEGMDELIKQMEEDIRRAL